MPRLTSKPSEPCPACLGAGVLPWLDLRSRYDPEEWRILRWERCRCSRRVASDPGSVLCW